MHVPGQGLSPDACGDLSIRFRSGGELFQPYGQPQRRTLKNLLYDAGIPPWQRERLPLLYSADTLIAVADRWIAQEYAVKSDQTGVVLRWQKIA
jgi:tRNA(Ile)-lysidine synthase